MDSSGTKDDGGTGEGLSSTAIIVLASVGSALGLILVLALWLYCRRRRKRNAAAHSASGDEDVKIQTLGRQYKIASISHVDANIRKLSLFAERKYSEASDSQREVATEMQILSPKPQTSGEAKASDPVLHPIGQTQAADEPDGTAVPRVALHAERKDSLQVPSARRHRSDSTYLDFDGNAEASRKSSVTSHHFTMMEVAQKSKGEVFPPMRAIDPHLLQNAPLAVAEESIPSSSESSSLLTASKHQDALSSYQRKSLPRPRSEYKNESARFVPKLPPKKKRMLHAKSAANMVPDADPDPGDEARQRLVSRSETCLLMDEDGEDHSDLPHPNLPPKTKPKLPPKQKINKSQDDLARIEQQFKTSMSQLARLSADYDDLPEEEEENISRHEFQDYDDPIHHGEAAGKLDQDYDDPPIQHSK